MADVANGPYFPDPFRHDKSFTSTFWNAILATALFRCWHLLIFFGVWSTAISVISHNIKSLGIASTLLTVIGTVLGFVISYRTTSSFERYNEGRKYWSQIVYASRTIARLIWFHVPDTMDIGPDMSEEEKRVRVLIEKKTVLNLVDAFCVSVKHYLRGESNIYYEDLYHTTKYLPTYGLPAGLPSTDNLTSDLPTSPKSVSFQQHQQVVIQRRTSNDRRPRSFSASRNHERPQRTVSGSAPHLPLPATTPGEVETKTEKPGIFELPKPSRPSKGYESVHGPSTCTLGEAELLPARDPPQYSYLDLFPFSLMVKFFTKRGRKLKGRKAATLRAKLQHSTQNMPLEISLYISSYIAALQNRKCVDATTTSNLIAALNQLVDALTGLERILTTPIPYSYSVHLWTVTIVYCVFLPFQLWDTLKFLTIPGTVGASFIFFGFLVAGEEIENPFGYDKNDLDLDHFTNDIIRQELAAISATPTPDPKDWVFSPVNNRVVDPHDNDAAHATPEEWVSRGVGGLLAALSVEGR